MSGVAHLVFSGPLVLAVPVAAAAGAVSFLSPCCLPLVPGYISYITGMSGADLQQRAARGRVRTLVTAGVSGAAAPAAAAAAAGPAGADTTTAPGTPAACRCRTLAGPARLVPGVAALVAS